VFTARYVLDIYIQYKLILTLVCKWYKKQGIEVLTKRKKCSHRASNPCHRVSSQAIYWVFLATSSRKPKNSIIRHVRIQKGGRLDLKPGDKIW